MKPFTTIAAFLVGLISVGHLLRLLLGWGVVIDEKVIPMWPSVVVVLLFAFVAVMVWREHRAA
jgi:hypothetical protein